MNTDRGKRSVGGVIPYLSFVLLPVWLTVPCVQAQFSYEIFNGTIAITGYDCSSGNAVIPATINGLPVTTIKPHSFMGCGLVTNIFIPDSVTDIWWEAFSYCPNLTRLTISSNLSTIGRDAFSLCPNLVSIDVAQQNPFFSSMEGVLFDKSKSTLIRCPEGRTGSYVVPDGVTELGEGAFYGCNQLSNLLMSAHVTRIPPLTFYGCFRLTAIDTVAESLALRSQDGVLFRVDPSTLIQCPGGKSGDYTVPDWVTGIGDAAFAACTSLTSITFPSSVTNIGAIAFRTCLSLAGVYFHGDAPTIDSEAFQLVNNATVYVLPGTSGWGPIFAGHTPVIWQPRVLTYGAQFGVRTNQFGFIIAWARDRAVIVDASAGLINPEWSPVSTNTTAADGTSYFGDSEWTNYPARFYRLRGL